MNFLAHETKYQNLLSMFLSISPKLNASSYLIRKRSEKTLFPYDRVKDDHFLENEGTRKSPATCLSVLEDAIQGSRIAPPPLSVRLLIKGICL